MERQLTIQRFAQTLQNNHFAGTLSISVKRKTQAFSDEIFQLLFSPLTEFQSNSLRSITAKFEELRKQLCAILNLLPKKSEQQSEEIVSAFFCELPNIYELLRRDAEAIYQGDPAAESLYEVILAYPGFMAIVIYRLAHFFYHQKTPIFPRLLSEYAHQLTGIDIHPGAEIGTSFCIDHGTGIVIGETTTIGNNVKLYQGVTLGALSVEKSLAKTKRHPTIEDNVIIYAQAVILGGETIIGHDSIVGGNSWITKSIPPYSFVVHESKVFVRTPNETNGGIEFVI